MKFTKFLTLPILVVLPLCGFSQDDSKYGDTPEQQTLCKEALSVYKSYKKQKNSPKKDLEEPKVQTLTYSEPEEKTKEVVSDANLTAI